MFGKKSTKKPNSFISDGLSIDESRISMLIISYMISFITTTAFCIYVKDTEALKTIFLANIGAITGINVTDSIMTNITKPTQESVTPTEGQDDWPKN